jgi:hypothetical protein
MVTTVLATAAVADPVFVFVPDDQGANDEPGQKDLTAQSSDLDNGTFYTAWKWDDTSWNGKNTGDACSLFDTDSPGNNRVDYAVCATVGGSPAQILQTRVYSCGDGRADRCTNPTLLASNAGSGWCSTALVTPGQFGDSAGDTQATCNITLAEAGSGVSDLDNGTLLNTCSYPSQEPNSDPSDCVLTITLIDTSIGTLPSGSVTWTAVLNDSATMNPTSATGSVVFKLYGVNTSGTCSTLIWTSASQTLVSGAATAHDGDLTTAADAGTPADAYVITNVNVDTDGIYYWTVDYTPSGNFNSSTSACGAERTTITPASLSHFPAS